MSKVFFCECKIFIFIDSFFSAYYNYITKKNQGETPMKEKIYTIPINEAIEADTECPFCAIAKRLEAEAVEYTLGAAMMEPDYRILCNEQGFCNHHFSQLYKKPNKLSLALILDSRFDELKKQFAKNKPSAEKPRLFKRAEPASPHKESCVICNKVNSTLDRYAEVFFYMWKADKTLSERVLASKGFCIPHFYYLAEIAKKHLPHPEEFIEPIFEKQLAELERIHGEVHHFTLKFDYRNSDLPWGNAKDSPLRAVEKSAGYIELDEKA